MGVAILPRGRSGTAQVSRRLTQAEIIQIEGVLGLYIGDLQMIQDPEEAEELMFCEWIMMKLSVMRAEAQELTELTEVRRNEPWTCWRLSRRNSDCTIPALRSVPSTGGSYRAGGMTRNA